MTPNYGKTEYALLRLLSASLRQNWGAARMPDLTEGEWQRLLADADRHEVLPLLSAVLEQAGLTEEQRAAVQDRTARTVHQSVQLQVLNAHLTDLLEQAGIQAITLKGCTVARLYPTPEFRKSSDIDLFVADQGAWERSVQMLRDRGFQPSPEWHADHHAVLISPRQEVVELHRTWTEPVQDKTANRYLEALQRESGQHCRPVDCQGLRVYGYDTPCQALYLLLHMLMHFLGSGFGLRNLCDWVVLWERCGDPEERAAFWRMAKESGAARFAQAVTDICVRYLHLPEEKSPTPLSNREEQAMADGLLRDILDAGEFGTSEADRMVGMSGSSLASYVREFHHQMHVNFPTAGKAVVLWPALWCATLFRFLNNNRRLNRPSVSAIMKKAGERGELVKNLTGSK